MDMLSLFTDNTDSNDALKERCYKSFHVLLNGVRIKVLQEFVIQVRE